MFSKKTCQRCGRKTNKSNSFCPSCGNPLKKSKGKEELGMLGENDSINEFEALSNSMFGGISGTFMNKMLSNTMRMLEKEMQKGMQEERNNSQNQSNNFPKTKIRLMINGKEIDLNKSIPQNGNLEKREKEKPAKFRKFSEEQIRKFSKLPKKQPKTELKRIADKISYEIEVPGVKSIEDVSITPLESSIEMKAISSDKAYSKSIPINLPIIGYSLSDELLILEFKGN